MHVSVALHAVEQRCVFVLHAEPVGHWLDVLHQHEEMVETHTSPLGLPAHALNALVQAPLTQQAPLQSAVSEHAALQVWVVESHAIEVGQSVGALHPHAPPATHA